MRHLCYNLRLLMSGRNTLLFFALLIGCSIITYSLGYASYPLLNPAPASVLTESAGATASDSPADMQLFWEVWHLLERDFYGDKPDATERLYGALHGLAGSFQDPYTVFVEPQPNEMQEDEIKGSFGGIGANLKQSEAGYLLQPMQNQPAALAGIQEGDLLVTVDDHPITADMTHDEVVALVRGEVDSEVVLGVRRINLGRVEALSFRIRRIKIETPSMEWRLLSDEAEMATVGYIRQTIFSERSTEEMRTALRELSDAGAKRYILDLRGNPGGLVDAAVAIADMWLDGGVLMIERYADGSEKTFEGQPGGEGGDAPLTIIVDAATASASEILAGALQDRGRARLVGEKTYGKGSVQLIYPLSDASSLHVTNAQWFTPSRHQISGQGLTPNVLVEPGVDPLPLALVELARLAKALPTEAE